MKLKTEIDEFTTIGNSGDIDTLIQQQAQSFFQLQFGKLKFLQNLNFRHVYLLTGIEYIYRIHSKLNVI